MLKIQGEITFGFSNNFLQTLKDHPGLKTIVLNSQGGHIYEARGAAKSIQDKGLNTHASRECSSPALCFCCRKRNAHWLRKQKSDFISMPSVSEIPCRTLTCKRSRKKTWHFFSPRESNFLPQPYVPTFQQNLWYPEYQELIDSGFLNSRIKFTFSTVFGIFRYLQPNWIPYLLERIPRT